MKTILLFLLTCIGVSAATPSFSSFNTNQFSTNNLFISIKDGAVITNLNVITDLFINSTNIVNLFAPSSVTNGATINPTDGYLPYRSNSTTFGDSPWYRINTNQLGFNGTSRFLFRSTAGFSENLGIGNNAMNTSVSGSANIGIGGSATDSVSSGSYNIGIGAGSNGSVTTTDANIAIGVNAQNQLVTGSQNIAIGLNSHQNDIAGTDNVAIGVSSMNTATNAVQNVAIGTGSLSQMLNGSYNVALGYRAGYTNSTMQKSILIGIDANALSGSDTNTIVIGANTVGAGSNTTVIGNTNTTAAHVIASGYDGTGTHFLSDDGTYKAAGGVGGDSIWTNITGYVTMVPGQTATNTLAFTSGAADNATNILLKVDSANYLSASGTLLAAFGNAGTNNYVISHDGAVTGGRNTAAIWGSNAEGATRFLDFRQVSGGDNKNFEYDFGSFHSDFTAPYSYFSFTGDTNDAALTIYNFNGVDTDTIELLQNGLNSQIRIIDGGVPVMDFQPDITSTGSAVAYLFDTSNTLTNGDKFVSIGNAGTTIFQFAPAEANNPAGQIVFGPGTTNVLYRSASNLIYTNGATAMQLLSVNGSGASLSIGTDNGGNPRLLGSAATLYIKASGSDGVVLNNGAIGPVTSGQLDSGQSGSAWKDISLTNRLLWQITGVSTNLLFDSVGVGSPEGVVTALPGSIYRNSSGGSLTTLWMKESGTGNTGWTGASSGSSAQVFYLAADETETTTTPNSLALSATLTAGAKYSFTLTLFVDNSVDADGSGIDFDGGSATMTSFRAQTKVFDNALAGSVQTTALATDIAVATLTGTGSFEVSGGFTVNAGGTFIPRFFVNSATTGTLTAFRNSILTVTLAQ